MQAPVKLTLAHKIQDTIDRSVARDRAEAACRVGLRGQG